MPDLVCEDWILYEPDYFGIVSKDPATGLDFVDTEELRKHIRVFGTKEQLEKEIQDDKYLIDEVYAYKVEAEGRYWYNIYSDTAETNKEVSQRLREYEKLYELNNKEVLIINII